MNNKVTIYMQPPIWTGARWETWTNSTPVLDAKGRPVEQFEVEIELPDEYVSKVKKAQGSVANKLGD